MEEFNFSCAALRRFCVCAKVLAAPTHPSETKCGLLCYVPPKTGGVVDANVGWNGLSRALCNSFDHRTNSLIIFVNLA